MASEDTWKKRLPEDLGAQIRRKRHRRWSLDVTHPDANKGHVVEVLSQALAVPPAQIVTMGDMPNDVLMFKKSGLSIAMGNASPEVQREASCVTASNEEEGFAKAIAAFILGRRAADNAS